ncbi:hypothetical protein PAXRUDRAFT_159272 [Paxillus rubicundulus Ve08.2h10]|uniref:Uncharacterized protein n=1 Tax=Paxillus rubicundulus Ve08.2h10 TaxID=930991 RepID=A0A0D0DG64_9AGAM|nr:hypothetical protein PAXRUDRAFT_159272 [Paxillus rubicundulus Ve08.2h10]
MDLAEFLNPAAKTHNIFNSTDEDIYQAIMDAKAAWEANSEGNSDEVNVGPVKLGPTHSDALQVALVVGKYIKDFDDLFMCKLDSMLGLLGKRTWVLEMHTMKDTNLNGYFEHQ